MVIRCLQSTGVYEGAGAKPGMVGSHEPAGIVVKMVSLALGVPHVLALELTSPRLICIGRRRRTKRKAESWRPRWVDQHVPS